MPSFHSGLSLLPIALAALILTPEPALAAGNHVLSATFGSAVSTPANPEPLESPRGVAFNESNDEVYVTDTANNRVEYFTATGEYLGQFNGETATAGQLSSPEGIAIDNDPTSATYGDVYVIDTGHNVLDKFSASGAFVAELLETEGAAEGIAGVAVDPSGGVWLYSKNSQAAEFDDQGSYVSGSSFNVKRGVLPGLAVDASDHLYVTTAAGFARRITPPEANGTLVTEQEFVSGIASDQAAGDLYVDKGTHIEHYALTAPGEVMQSGGGTCAFALEAGCPPSDVFGSETPEGGGLHDATGLAVDSHNRTLYVANTAANDVDIYVTGEAPEAPHTKAATSLEATGATLHGELNPGGATGQLEYTFAYNSGSTCTGGQSTPVPAGVVTEAKNASVQAPLTGLQPNAQYTYCLVATNGFGSTASSEEISFTTLSQAPLVSGELAGSLTQTQATLQAQINPNNEATDWHVEYSTNPTLAGATSLPSPDATIAAGYGDTPVSETLSALAPSTTYYWRLVATSLGGGKTAAPIQSFLMRPATPSTQAPTHVLATEATFNGSFNPGEQATGYHFEYGKTACAPATCPTRTATEGPVPAPTTPAVPISMLIPFTTSHYRLVVENASGPTYGSEAHVTTLPWHRPRLQTRPQASRLIRPSWGAKSCPSAWKAATRTPPTASTSVPVPGTPIPAKKPRSAPPAAQPVANSPLSPCPDCFPIRLITTASTPGTAAAKLMGRTAPSPRTRPANPPTTHCRQASPSPAHPPAPPQPRSSPISPIRPPSVPSRSPTQSPSTSSQRPNSSEQPSPNAPSRRNPHASAVRPQQESASNPPLNLGSTTSSTSPAEPKRGSGFPPFRKKAPWLPQTLRATAPPLSETHKQPLPPLPGLVFAPISALRSAHCCCQAWGRGTLAGILTRMLSRTPVLAGLLIAALLLSLAGSVDLAQASLLSWSAPRTLDANGAIHTQYGVACPTSSQCTAVDTDGQEVTFDPTAPGTPTPITIDVAHQLNQVACPSSSQCTAIGQDGQEVTFDPTAPGIPTPTTILSGLSLGGLACPSSTQCTAVGQNGRQVTFNPTAPGSATPTTIDTEGAFLTGVACPSSTQCSAVDYKGREVTFNPAAPGSPTPTTIDTGADPELDGGVACPSSTQCTAVGYGGQEVTFNPTAPGAATETTIDTGATPFLQGVACPSSTQCTVVDFHGHQITFDPTAPGTPTPTTIDTGHSVRAVACPSSTQCTAVDESGLQVTFDPTAPGSPTPTPIDTGGFLTQIACPSSSQCTTVDGHGQEVTFDPAAPGAPTPTAIDSSHLTGLACPSPTQCTAVDTEGREVSFDPTAPGTPTPITIDKTSQFLTALACPSVGKCVAVDADGEEVTFDPAAPGVPTPTAISIFDLNAIACPSAGQCTAIGNGGQAVTFDPAAPGSATETTLDTPPGASLQALACPSSTQCTALDSGGREITFNPTAPGNPARTTIDAADQFLTALACPSLSKCVALDSDGDVLQGDPAHPNSWVLEPIPGANSLTALACTSVSQCIAVDLAGNGFLGVPRVLTATALQSSSADPVTNRPVTLTATVTPVSPTPSGTVSFENNGTVIPGCANQPLAFSGASYTATCQAAFTAASSPESLTALFTPAHGSGLETSTSPTEGLTVAQDSTTTSLAVSSNSPAVGANVTYTATATPAHPGATEPSGAIEFLDAGTAIAACSAQPLSQGASSSTATCTLSYPAAGSHNITAAYLPDANFAGSTSSPQAIAVSASPVTTTTSLSAPVGAPAPGPTIAVATVGRPKLSGTTVSLTIGCTGATGASCTVTLALTATKTLKRGKLVAVTAINPTPKTTKLTGSLGTATVTLPAGHSKLVHLRLNAAVRHLLTTLHKLSVKLTASQSTSAGARLLWARTITFTTPAKKNTR